jgi:hypothetical protein
MVIKGENLFFDYLNNNQNQGLSSHDYKRSMELKHDIEKENGRVHYDYSSILLNNKVSILSPDTLNVANNFNKHCHKDKKICLKFSSQQLEQKYLYNLIDELLKFKLSDVLSLPSSYLMKILDDSFTSESILEIEFTYGVEEYGFYLISLLQTLCNLIGSGKSIASINNLKLIPEFKISLNNL